MAKIENSNNAVYFLSLSLENVCCFGSKQTLDLSDGNGNPARWTVILGDNGVGKTTLLQVLASMEFIEENINTVNNGERILRRTKLEQTNAVKWIKSGTDYFSSIPIFAIRKNLISNSFHENITFEYIQKIYLSMTNNVPQEQGIKELLNMTCIAYGATRQWGETSLAKKLGTDATASLFNQNENLIDPEEWLLQTDYAAKTNPKFKNDLELVKETLINLLPEITDIKIIPPDKSQRNHQVVFINNNLGFRINSLSLGYQTIITWIVDLAAHLFERYPDSPNPIAEPAVVLIDEIDLHLHPKWQREIMGYLTERFTNTQFIVTAHSPLIVQAAEDANIVVLKRDGDEVIIDSNPSATKGWRVDQLLASDLFGLNSSRSEKYENWLKERREILSKANLTQEDKNKLEQLELNIGDLPTAESVTNIKAMNIIHRAAKLLEAEK